MKIVSKLKDSLFALQREYRISQRWVEHFLSLFEEVQINQKTIEGQNAPNKIYLQVGEDNEDKDFNDLSEVTWSIGRVFDSDIEYVNIEEPRNIAKRLIRDEIKRLERIRYIDGARSPMEMHRVVEQLYSCRSVLRLLSREKSEE